MLDVVCGVKDMDRKLVEETIYKNTMELFFKNHWNLFLFVNSISRKFHIFGDFIQKLLSVITWVDPSNTEQEGSIYHVISEYAKKDIKKKIIKCACRHSIGTMSATEFGLVG